MAEHNDRNQADDLYDEAAPRSIFAATWFRAVLVLIVLGVVGAVAVPYILDAMNSPRGNLGATAKAPATVPAPSQPPSAITPVTPPPGTPATGTPTPTTPSTTTQPSITPPAATVDKPADKKDATIASTTTVPEVAKPESRPAPESAMKESTASKPARKVARATPSTTKAAATRGQWFVQVGAFKDSGAARKIAAKLRDDNYKVDESAPGTPTATVAKATTSPSAGGGDRYDVIVSGQSPADLSQRLTGRGLTAEAIPNGAVVKPSLPLRDAVALSKDLAVDGLKVQVRRAGGSSAPAVRSSSAATAPAGADGLHRVSVGGFSDRATALATLKELEGKGYKPFLTRR
jgi:hypothetical protein